MRDMATMPKALVRRLSSSVTPPARKGLSRVDRAGSGAGAVRPAPGLRR